MLLLTVPVKVGCVWPGCAGVGTKIPRTLAMVMGVIIPDVASVQNPGWDVRIGFIRIVPVVVAPSPYRVTANTPWRVLATEVGPYAPPRNAFRFCVFRDFCRY